MILASHFNIFIKYLTNKLDDTQGGRSIDEGPRVSVSVDAHDFGLIAGWGNNYPSILLVNSPKGVETRHI